VRRNAAGELLNQPHERWRHSLILWRLSSSASENLMSRSPALAELVPNDRSALRVTAIE